MENGSQSWAKCTNWDESERGHREVGETAAALNIDQLIAIGDAATAIAEGARHAGLQKTTVVNSTSEAAELLNEIAAPGDLILIKGSRASRTEEVIEHFAVRHSSRSEERRVGKACRYVGRGWN